MCKKQLWIRRQKRDNEHQLRVVQMTVSLEIALVNEGYSKAEEEPSAEGYDPTEKEFWDLVSAPELKMKYCKITVIHDFGKGAIPSDMPKRERA